MEVGQAQTTVPEGVPSGRAPVKVLASDDVRNVVRERGGSLYIWTDVHGVCEGKVTLLQVDIERPSDEDLRFERISAEGFDVFLAIGSLLWPGRFSSMRVRQRAIARPV